MLRRVLDLLAPPACWSCGGAVALAAPLCPRCAAALPWRGPGDGRRDGPLDRWDAPLALTGSARDLVHVLKFRDAPPVAALMAAHLVHALPPAVLDPRDTLIAVPAHPGRRRRRGYDHAEALAHALAARTGQEVASPLVRTATRDTRQRGAGRAQRLSGAALAITAHRRPPSRCLLVDDVRTTGATLRVCAEVLRAAGARRVHAVAYAQAP